MKDTFKKYWKNLLAFAVSGAMCLGMGIFMLASPGAQTQLDNNSSTQLSSEVTETSGELLLVSVDGQNSNGGTSKGGYLTVSQWSALGTYGDLSSLISSLNPGSANDPAGQAIWAEIQNDKLFGNVDTFTVTIWFQSPEGVYRTPIQVVAGSNISAIDNVLTIAGTTFTASAPSSDDYVFAGWTIDGSAIPANSSVTSNISVVAQFEGMGEPWTDSGTYTSGIFNGYTWVTFGTSSNKWVIVGGSEEYAPDSPLSSTAFANSSQTDDLSENQILLLSENLVANSVQYNSSYSETAWTGTTLCTYLNNSDNYDDWGISEALYSSIVAPNLTTQTNGSAQESVTSTSTTTKKIFTLAYGYSDENFCLTTYLGGDGSSSSNYIANYNNSASDWWLRSGYCDSTDFASYVISNGYVSDYIVDDSLGVRPAFILNI